MITNSLLIIVCLWCHDTKFFTPHSILWIGNPQNYIDAATCIYLSNYAITCLFCTTEVLPGPSDYPERSGGKVPGGKFTTSDRTKTTYPDCLHYKSDLKTSKRVPGASAYNPKNHCISKNSNPKHSFTASKKKTKAHNTRGNASLIPSEQSHIYI